MTFQLPPPIKTHLLIGFFERKLYILLSSYNQNYTLAIMLLFWAGIGKLWMNFEVEQDALSEQVWKKVRNFLCE